MTNTESPIGPRDFDPYRAEISDCHCPELCLPMMGLNSRNSGTYVQGSQGAREHLDYARGLLAALKAGTHNPVSFREHVAKAKVNKAARLAQARENGASPEELATIERGYATVKMSDFYATGMGLGIGPR